MGCSSSSLKDSYTCPKCRVHAKVIKKEISGGGGQVQDYYDSNRQKHAHDTRTGTVITKCKRGHVHEQVYSPVCWCGWSNKNL